MNICRRCGRKLRGLKSVERGYGPVCYRKEELDQAFGGGIDLPKPEAQCPGQMEISDYPGFVPEGSEDDGKVEDDLSTAETAPAGA